MPLSLPQGGSTIRAGGKRVDERGQRTELAQPSAYDPPHHQSHPLVREVSHWLPSNHDAWIRFSTMNAGHYYKTVVLYTDVKRQGLMLLYFSISPLP